MVEDFRGDLLERVIQHYDWSKAVETPHIAYSILVREFFAYFNVDIDVLESSHRH